MHPNPGHIEPTSEQFEALLATAGEAPGPVVMLNLLKFHADGGRESFARYGAEVQPHLDRVGASPVYAGDVGGVVIGRESDGDWDAVLLVSYPSRAAFVEMVTDAGYQEVTRHRTAALRTSALVATDPWGGGRS